jgi:U3 small nucleolar RNA-associated protein 22
MSPFPAKRRKLDHGLTASADNESEEHGQQPLSNLPKATPASIKPARSQRATDSDDAALYARGLYKSSLFKLQVDELLREVVPNYEKGFSGVTEALHRLKGLIEGIQERDALSVGLLISSCHIFLLTFTCTDFRRCQVLA